MQTSRGKTIERRDSGGNVWLRYADGTVDAIPNEDYRYNILESEEAVGAAMFRELISYADEKRGDIVMVLLGGRGGAGAASSSDGIT